MNLRKQKLIDIFKTNPKDKQGKKHTCSKDRRQTEGGDKREKAKNRHRESILAGNPSVWTFLSSIAVIYNTVEVCAVGPMLHYH